MEHLFINVSLTYRWGFEEPGLKEEDMSDLK